MSGSSIQVDGDAFNRVGKAGLGSWLRGKETTSSFWTS